MICDASFLLTLVFFTGAIQGCVALVAAAELCSAGWIPPIKKNLLSAHKLFPLSIVFFVLIVPQINVYPWGERAVWFSKWFFVLRNTLLLLVTYLLALKYAQESLSESVKTNRYAVLYLVAFVFSQSLIAFDWVMPLEFPWVSTLLGGYFFIESLYTGIAIAALLTVSLLVSKKSDELTSTLRDVATLLFGFSLLWVGLYYAQYLVIWYGNMAEETSFFIRRLSSSPLREISYSILPALFLIPFIVLLFRKTKLNPFIVTAMSAIVLYGIIAERYVFLRPNLSFKLPIFLVTFTVVAILFWAVLGHDKPLAGSNKKLH